MPWWWNLGHGQLNFFTPSHSLPSNLCWHAFPPNLLMPAVNPPSRSLAPVLSDAGGALIQWLRELPETTRSLPSSVRMAVFFSLLKKPCWQPSNRKCPCHAGSDVSEMCKVSTLLNLWECDLRTTSGNATKRCSLTSTVTNMQILTFEQKSKMKPWSRSPRRCQ